MDYSSPEVRMLSSSIYNHDIMSRNSISSYYSGTFEYIWSLENGKYNKKNLNGNLEIISKSPNFDYVIDNIVEFDFEGELVLFRWALIGYLMLNTVVGLYFLRRIYVSQEKYYHQMPISSIVQGSMVEINLFFSALIVLEGYFLYFLVLILFTLGLFCPFVPFFEYRYYEDRASASKYAVFMVLLGLLVVLNLVGLFCYEYFAPLSVAFIPLVAGVDYFFWNKKARKINEIIILTFLRSFLPYYAFFYKGNFHMDPVVLGFDFILVQAVTVASIVFLCLQQSYGSRFGLKLRCKLFDFRNEFEPENMFL